jgi:hypothetical protein
MYSIIENAIVSEFLGLIAFSLYRRKFYSERILEQLFVLAIGIAMFFISMMFIGTLTISIWMVISVAINIFTLNFLIFVLLLINIDRSRSTYVIAWTKFGWVKIVNKKFQYNEKILNIESNTAMLDQRILEHKSRKILRITDNEIELLFLGKTIYALANIMSKVFNLVNWKEKTNL